MGGAALKAPRFAAALLHAAFLPLILALLPLPAPARAAPPSACSFEALSGSRPGGLFAALLLRCDLDGSGNPSSWVTVVRRDGSPQSKAQWLRQPNLSSHIWLFDYRADRRVELAVDFYTSPLGAHADLYESPILPDDWADSPQSLQERLAVRPPGVKVLAPAGWWSKDGRVNFNLELRIDGPVVALPAPSELLQTVYPLDGTTDVAVSVRDLDSDGRPDYDLRRRTPLPPDAERRLSLARAFFMVNSQDDEPPPDAVLPWPLLGGYSYGYLTSSPHAASRPPIQVDWAQGRIRAVGEFVSSRRGESQWFVYSFNDLQPGRLNRPNFESPFAWYDLANDGDRVAELAVRFGYYPPADPAVAGGASPDALNIVRYSWDQDNDGLWDYKLGLLGKHTLASRVWVGDLGLEILPYKRLPGWVAQQEWGSVAWVAAENGGSAGEGIYVWDHPAWFTEGYFLGREGSPIPPPESENAGEFGSGAIPAGFRGEFHNEYLDRVTLYYSPIDQKVHLKNLAEGVWNIDGRRSLRYRAVDGPYVDRWEKYLDQELIESAAYLSGHLFASTPSSLRVAKTSLPLSAAEFGPPANHQEWAHIRTLLARSKTAEPALPVAGGCRYAGVRLDHLRPVTAGFRFELHIGPQLSIPGEDCLGLLGLSPGFYRFEYHEKEGAFQIDPARRSSPQLLELAPLSAAVPFSPIALRLRLHNPGDIDLDPARLHLSLKTQHGNLLLDDRTISLPAGETAAFFPEWTPPSAGEFEFQITIFDEGGKTVLDRSARVTVSPSGAGSGLNILQLSSSGGWWINVLLLLLIASLLAGLCWRAASGLNDPG